MRRASVVTGVNAGLSGGGSVRLALDDGWCAELERQNNGARMRISRDGLHGGVQLEIAMTHAGPVIRVQATAVEIESEGDIVARCDRFRIEAREEVSIVSSGSLRAEGREVDVRATHGSARIKASDDVQLLGEQVLLNCERPAELPAWVPAALPVERTVQRQDEAGDPDVLRGIDPG